MVSFIYFLLLVRLIMNKVRVYGLFLLLFMSLKGLEVFVFIY